MIDKVTFKQLYLGSRIRTQSWFEENVARFKRREEEQLKVLLLKHMDEAGMKPTVKNGEDYGELV